MNCRKVELLVEIADGDSWVPIEFSQLNIGDKFRMFDVLDDGQRIEPVVNKDGQSRFICLTEPFVGETGVLTVNTDGY